MRVRTIVAVAAVVGVVAGVTIAAGSPAAAQAPASKLAAPATAKKPAADASPAFGAFWSAPDPQAAAQAAADIVHANVPFDDAYRQLKRGRVYRADVAKGIVRLSHHFPLGEFPYTVEVPDSYDPSRAYQVRVQLHGGVTGREDGTIRGTGGIGPLAGAEQIYVMPNSWRTAPWWSNAQLENMDAILDTVKRTYNVDENRVVLSGTSDGATALYYFAMRDTTPFASFLALNGAMVVLQSPMIGLQGLLFPNNLLNKPWFIVNGARDPLYPTQLVDPYIAHMKRGGVELVYHPQATGVHNTSWFPTERDAFETFVKDHPRKPVPDRLTWESAVPSPANRASWLVIDRVSAKEDMREPLPDLNLFGEGPLDEFGLHVDGTTVTRVDGGTDADGIGFKVGDVVTAVDGKAPPAGGDFLEWLGTFKRRSDLTFAVTRDGAPVEFLGFFDPVTPLPPLPLFPHRDPSGRVDLVREGNTVRATTRGVDAFTLLLSPDAFDLSKPVVVIADGKTVFSGRVTKSLATLMKWAARDNDRTMLFAAELPIVLNK